MVRLILIIVCVVLSGCIEPAEVTGPFVVNDVLSCTNSSGGYIHRPSMCRVLLGNGARATLEGPVAVGDHAYMSERDDYTYFFVARIQHGEIK